MQINALLFLEFSRQVLDQAQIEILTTQERVTVCGQHFKLFLAFNICDLDNGDIKRTPTQIVDSNLAITGRFIHTKSQGSRCRLVDNAFYIQSGNAACILGGLAL